MSEKARILLIDDDPDVQRMIGLILHRAGYEVFKADNGVEGLEKIDALKPDLVILDVMMPLVSGLNVCRRIRSQPHTRHLPVLMLSAMAGADDFVKGFDVGADNYATKPINAKELVARVRALLNRVTTPAPKRAARTISLVGAKGGVGVTSTAANLAVSLTQQGHQVVLIELRPFGGALRFQLQIDREQDNLAHLLALDPKRIKRPEIERCLVKHSSGLRAILPAPDPHALPLTAGHVEALFDYLSLHVDYILLDLPPAVDEHLQRALALSDQILLVTEPEPLAVKCARTQISAFKRWDVFERVNLVIVQRALSAASLNRVEVENMVGMGGDQVGAARWESRALEVDYRMRQGAVSSIPAAPELFHEAMRDRVPVVLLEPGTKVARAIADLAQWVVDRDQEPDAEPAAAEPPPPANGHHAADAREAIVIWQ